MWLESHDSVAAFVLCSALQLLFSSVSTGQGKLLIPFALSWPSLSFTALWRPFSQAPRSFWCECPFWPQVGPCKSSVLPASATWQIFWIGLNCLIVSEVFGIRHFRWVSKLRCTRPFRLWVSEIRHPRWSDASGCQTIQTFQTVQTFQMIRCLRLSDNSDIPDCSRHSRWSYSSDGQTIQIGQTVQTS